MAHFFFKKKTFSGFYFLTNREVNLLTFIGGPPYFELHGNSLGRRLTNFLPTNGPAFPINNTLTNGPICNGVLLEPLP